MKNILLKGHAFAALMLALSAGQAVAQAPVLNVSPAVTAAVGPVPSASNAMDQVITGKVVALLSADQKLKGQISVITSNGVVSLYGKVGTVPMIYRAVELTSGIEGVKHVNDDALISG